MRLIAIAAILFVSASASAADPVREEFDDSQFDVLFDGTSLAGWHVSTQTGHSSASMHTSGGKWRLEDGAIVGSQDIPGNGGIILTDRKYGDFEVVVEMNNDYGPDSGLFLRSTRRARLTSTWWTTMTTATWRACMARDCRAGSITVITTCSRHRTRSR